MEIIEEQFQKIMSAFPNVKTVENSIYHIEISLKKKVSLDIYYKTYPKRPKVKLIKSDGTIFKNLNMIITSLQTWKKKSAPDIVDLIREILLIIESTETNVVLIKRELIDGLLDFCYKQHPREILGLLRVDRGLVSEFILPPGSTTSETSGVFFPGRIPLDATLEGTIHSHPSGNPYPSQVDLQTVFRTKRFHFIAAYPYNNYNCIKCFDQLGNELKFRIM